MNIRRLIIWFSFFITVGLIIWGLVAADRKSKRIVASVPLPSEVVATDHIRGSVSAPVTLVEYGDFQCPACGAFYPLVEKIRTEYGSSTLRFVFRHFPLAQHVNSVPAAEASEAAFKQGKFWEMYDILYIKQKDWSDVLDPKTLFVGYARDLKLDTEKFSSDYDIKEVKDMINTSYLGAAKAGVNSTPTFFLNGVKISPQSYEEFKKLIDATLPKISL